MEKSTPQMGDTEKICGYSFAICDKNSWNFLATEGMILCPPKICKLLWITPLAEPAVS